MPNIRSPRHHHSAHFHAARSPHNKGKRPLKKIRQRINIFLDILESMSLRDYFSSLLAVGATLSVGVLSYAGAIALGFSVPFAIFAFIITAAIEAQVFYNNIKQGLKNLIDMIKHKKITSILFIALFSVLFALSFGATTLSSAAALLPFGISVVIAAVSALAFFLIIYTTLVKLSEVRNNFFSKKRSIITKIFTIAVILLTAFITWATANTWWLETQEGFQLLFAATPATILKVISAPFCIIGMGLFVLANSIKSIIEICSTNISELKQNIKKNITKELIKNPRLKYNPAYYLTKIVFALTAIILSIAHSVCQALIAGRTNISTIGGTALDFLVDGGYGLFEMFTHKHKHHNHKHHNHRHQHRHYHHDHDHNDTDHNHQIFDAIVAVSQFIFTAPFKIITFIVDLSINYFKNPTGKSLRTCLDESWCLALNITQNITQNIKGKIYQPVASPFVQPPSPPHALPSAISSPTTAASRERRGLTASPTP
ncbi:MAG: hypothetical protein KBD64_06020 [Gammaproteobacteria bacterium]|nr:hypothetical protein [Gammaproteobacteria bacterium]